MKAPLQPVKSFGSAASSAPAQRKGGLKTITDNRSSAIAQRKLQGVVGNIPAFSTPVAQLVKMVVVPAYSGRQIDIDDPEVVADLIEMMNDEDDGPAIKREILLMPEVIAAVNERRPGLLANTRIIEGKALTAVKKRVEDEEAWIVGAISVEGEKDFLRDVIGKARDIIPHAFNRRIEMGEKTTVESYTDTAYECKDRLIRSYAQDCARAGIMVRNNYIHPAALEKIYEVVNSTAPEGEAQEASVAGVCKDFASIVYGLILQNDAAGRFKPQLAFMHGHVYVSVQAAEGEYAVDAWLNGKVITKAEHEKEVTRIHAGIYAASELDLFNGREPQASLNTAYEKAELAQMVWYENEARYKELATMCWHEGKGSHVNRSSV